jgi:DnaJ-domain-containing protein 1
MFENIGANGWMIIVGCLLLGFCVVYFIIDKPDESHTSPANDHARQSSDSDGANEDASSEGFERQHSGTGEGGERRTSGPDHPKRERHWSEVLDVPAAAHIDEIKAAYRKKMAQYHPDKVASLGPELRDVADKLTKEINAAYDRANLERS